jgi:hypothetical protein
MYSSFFFTLIRGDTQTDKLLVSRVSAGAFYVPDLRLKLSVKILARRPSDRRAAYTYV